jgi:hypothetical protein
VSAAFINNSDLFFKKEWALDIMVIHIFLGRPFSKKQKKKLFKEEKNLDLIME